MGSLEEHFQHLNILCLRKLYSFSASNFMHSYNKLLPNHFDEYFVPLSSIHYHSTRLATSKNLFLPRVNSSSGKCSLKFTGPKYGLQYQTILNFQPLLPSNGNLTLWEPTYDTFVLQFRLKNSCFRLPYQRLSSSVDCARDLFKGSNGSVSLIDCTRKKIFWLGVVDFLWLTS